MKKHHLAAFLCTLPLLCGCAQPSAVRELFAMDTYMQLTASGNAAETALDAAQQRILALESLLAVTDEKSETWAINHADGVPVELSADTARLLQTAQEIGAQTDGALDISLYPVLSAWGFTMDTQNVPDAQTLAQARALVDYRRIVLHENTVTLPEGMQVDFGALAKGYAGDCAVEILREYGISSALLNLGGNVQAIGSKPDGSPWNIAVQNPAAPSAPLCSLAVTDAAVITSGNYERYFIAEDGTKYGHILDPATGAPVDNELASVTIVGTSGVRCDALSTALFVLGLEDAADFWRNSGDFEMLLVTQDDTLYYTQGLSEALTLPDGRTAEVITRD